MKVFVKEQSGLSRAMARVTRALVEYAPSWIHAVDERDAADFEVLHVIGYPETVEAVDRLRASDKKFALIMYCIRTTQRPNTGDWLPLWQAADAVWSYYNLRALLKDDNISGDFSFYHTPLGVDTIFAKETPHRFTLRDVGVMTSGYVSGACAEAIEEVAVAANNLGLQTVHIGPMPVGLMREVPKTWRSVNNISDAELAALYRRSRWVSGLRHGEGFELPALEGLCCGARPLVFDRPEMRRWYGDHAMYIKECDGDELVAQLQNIMTVYPDFVSPFEHSNVVQQFDWRSIVHGFWEHVRESQLVGSKVGAR